MINISSMKDSDTPIHTHPMPTKLSLTIVLALIAVPCMVFGASAPPPVTSVTAMQTNQGIRVQWQAPEGATDIAAYHVYFSRNSILQSGGDYDDFERTTGTETSYTFSAAPVGGASVTFGVLAVNTAGVESEGFVTEATIALVAPNTTSSVPSSAPTATVNAAIQAGTTSAAPSLVITTIVADTATGVSVSFSAPIAADLVIGPEAFIIIDGSGTLLAISRVERRADDASALLIHTAEQSSGRPYALAVTRQLRGTQGESLDPATFAPVTFLGFQSMENAVLSAPTPIAAPVPVPALERPVPTPYVRQPMPSRIEEVPAVPSRPRRDDLPDSGPGLLAIIGLAGAGAGLRTVRRLRRSPIAS